MSDEIVLLNAEFDATSLEIQAVIDYYCTVRLMGKSPEVLEFSPDMIRKMDTLLDWEGPFMSLGYITIDFKWEGHKQIWLGATQLGDGPLGRHEHYIGYIGLDKVKLNSDHPINVTVVCNWEPFVPFFQGLSTLLNDKYLSSLNKTELRKRIEEYLNKEDLKTLCVDLGVDYDNLSGEEKASKVRELIELMQRQGRVLALINELKTLRPNVKW